MQSERQITSYDKLKKALLSEFGHYSKPSHVHQLLANRTRLEGKKLMQYFLRMREISNNGNIYKHMYKYDFQNIHILNLVTYITSLLWIT